MPPLDTCIAALLSVLLFLEAGRIAGRAFAQQPETPSSVEIEKDVLPLEMGKTIKRELADGQTHYYKITLEAGQYLHLVLDQKDIHVIVTLFGPVGKKLVEVDTADGEGPEPVSTITDTEGSYTLAVRPLRKNVSAGRYEVRVTDLRMATGQDRSRVLAEKTYAESKSLKRQGTAESLRRAIEKCEQALELFRAVGDRQREGSTLLHLGSIHASLGEKQKALDYFKQALTLWQAVDNRNGEAVTLNDLGVVYSSLGEMQKALDYNKQSLQLRRAVGDRDGEATTLSNIGAIYTSLGEMQKALDYHDQALQLKRAVGDRSGEAVILNNLGVVYISLGETQKVLDYYDQALQLRRAVEDRSGEANTLNNIGYVNASLGEMQKALDYYNQAFALMRATGNRGGEASTLNNMGLAYRSLGEWQKAVDYYNQALALMRVVGDRGGEASTLNNIGFVSDSLGEKQKALNYYSQALQLKRAVGDRSGEAITLNNIGSVYNSLGERQKAQDCYNRVLELSRVVGDRRIEATALLGIARLKTAQNKLFEAQATIESALNIIETFRTKIPSPNLRSSYFATTQDFYELNINILMQLHKLHPDQGYDRAALQTAERARARNLLEGFAETRLEIRSGVDPALIERERALQQLLNAKTERQMRLLNGKHTDEQAAAAANELKVLTAQYQDVEAEIRVKNPHYAALTQPRPLNSEEIQKQLLDDRTLLVEYFLGKDCSYLWVVSASSVRSYELPKRADIEEAALRVKRLLTARANRQKGETRERWQVRITRAESKYWAEAERLSQMILGPAIAELSGKRLAIVSDGELQDVAFGALPVPPASGDGKIKTTTIKVNKSGDWLPLIVRHEIVSLPSASALAVLQRETAGRRPAAKAVAVLADPVFDKDDERIKLTVTTNPIKESEPEIYGKHNGDFLRATKEVMGAGGVISRLPFSREEAEAILSVAPRATSLMALDFNANRAMATSAELGQYQIVHFATHGLLNKIHPELSGILLSLVDRQGKPQNGFLQLHDVYNLDLPVELVVLSACQTGLGKAVRGEGLIGLTRGFMYAGAKRVVASLWGVQDQATAELMKRFYGAMLGERRMRPAEALRTAQIEMWRQRRWQSPYYWGGFTLYGEW